MCTKGEHCKKIGCPKGDNNMVKSYTIRMDDATFVRLETYCKFTNVAKSEAIRKAINDMVEDCAEIKNITSLKN